MLNFGFNDFERHLKKNEPLAHYTSFRIGGPARFLYKARKPEELTRAVEWAWKEEIPFIVLGGGSNVLVADEGFPGLVVINACSGWEVCEEEGELLVKAASGTPLGRLVQLALKEGWAGLEWAIGIPGTVGGAVVNNAGAFGSSMVDVLSGVWVLKQDGHQEYVLASELALGYRDSAFRAGGSRRGDVILEVELLLRQGDRAELIARAQEYREERRRRQPAEPCAGSVFKNPPGDFAARLIEAVELKGFRIGDAQFSAKHANFIVNLGKARARDVLELIHLAQERVYKRFGVELELEVELVGF